LQQLKCSAIGLGLVTILASEWATLEHGKPYSVKQSAEKRAKKYSEMQLKHVKYYIAVHLATS